MRRPRRGRKVLALSAAAGIGLASQQADAEILTYYFGGEIDYVFFGGEEWYEVIAGLPVFGHTARGSATFDTDTATAPGTDAQVISFEFEIPAINARWAGTGGVVNYVYTDYPSSDHDSLLVSLGTNDGAVYTEHTFFVPTDGGYHSGFDTEWSGVLPDLVDGFPVNFYRDIDAFSKQGLWAENDEGDYQLFESFDTGWISDVPEPASAALLGLTALAMLRRRKQQETGDTV